MGIWNVYEKDFTFSVSGKKYTLLPDWDQSVILFGHDTKHFMHFSVKQKRLKSLSTYGFDLLPIHVKQHAADEYGMYFPNRRFYYPLARRIEVGVGIFLEYDKFFTNSEVKVNRMGIYSGWIG